MYRRVETCLDIDWGSEGIYNQGPDWAHWYADGGGFVLNVLVGDALLMNSIE